MQLDFVSRALIGGVGIAAMAGPLGSIILWRRLAYFGDAFSHSTLLGVALALILNIHLYLGLFLICITVAFLLLFLSSIKILSFDTLLGILSHSFLALGLILMTTIKNNNVDLLGLLLGDILAIHTIELILIYSTAFIVLIGLKCIWRPLLAMTVNEESAKVEGININLMRIRLMMTMAFVFAISMKLVGALLITALVIIPPAVARLFAKSPEQMAIGASLIGVVSVVGGIYGSCTYDWPTGPAIVSFASLLFFLLLSLQKIIKYRN
ncbi:MAG: zinc transporter permease [Francisellaceae bacterium]|nr:zinc transporter permease [Francisellaceae bacterium]